MPRKRRSKWSGTAPSGHRARPLQATDTLDLSDLTRVTLYEPEELVLTAQAGTPLAELEALLAENGQMLAFEPPDFGRCWARQAEQTIGGVLSLQSVRAAADQGRGGARPLPGLRGGQRARRGFQGRRQGGEERHRL